MFVIINEVVYTAQWISYLQRTELTAEQELQRWAVSEFWLN